MSGEVSNSNNPQINELQANDVAEGGFQATGKKPGKAPKATAQQIAAQQANENQWQTAAIQLLLPELTTTLLTQISKELDLVASLNDAFEKASVASGKDEVDAAKVTMMTTIASAPATFLATGAMAYQMGKTTPEMKGLNDQHAALRDELAGHSSGVKTGFDDKGPGRSKEEIQGDLDDVSHKRTLVEQKKQMLSQLPASLSQAAGEMVRGSGSIASAGFQMAAKINQAEAAIYQQLAQTMMQYISQAKGMIEQMRNVSPYESQTRAVAG
jgi:hypothetical protein